MALMVLKLKELPETTLGIYGTNKSQLPKRMRLLHPDAADSILKIESDGFPLRFSDMWRSAESSLQASQEKRGVQKPAFSGHNFGFSIDADVQDCMKRFNKDKATLDDMMNSYGWYCHRKDHILASESWHYNYFGAESNKYLTACSSNTSTSTGLEAKIRDYYGAFFSPTSDEIQTYLQKLGLYSGDIDGIVGPLCAQAVKAFQRAWNIAASGIPDPVTCRLLAFVGADKEIS